MKIGINSLYMIPNKVGGTEYLMRSFINHLQKNDQKNEYIIFCNRENFRTFEITNSKWEKVNCGIYAESRIVRIIYEQLVLPILSLRYGCQILHSFGYFGPIFNFSKHVVTIHDTNWKDQKEDIGTLQLFLLKFLVEANIRMANTIVTDSDFSKKRLSKYFPNYKNKFKVIKPGLDENFTRMAKSKLNKLIKGKYILCVAAMYPHKKIPYLFKIWENLSLLDPKLELVIIGSNGADYEEVKELVKKTARIHHFEKVPFKDLVSYYKWATAFILPSVYEGFGFPVYEASYFDYPVFVGDINLYDESIKSKLKQLTFNAMADAKKIYSAIGKKAISKSNLSYEQSTNKLIKLYEISA